MVNYGVSKGCGECKKRKKKCDEARPSCTRCSRAGRRCPGYQSDSDLIFRHAISHPDSHPLAAHSEKQSSIIPKDPGNLQWAELEQLAFQTFISHFCIPSADRTISRGFFAGLPALIEQAGPTSVIAHACKIVAMANLGKSLHSPILIQKARTMYASLLSSFILAISDEATSTTIQSLMTAVLLGFYEIIMTTTVQRGAHIAHARGVSAILQSHSSPFVLLCGGKLFRLPEAISLKDWDGTGVGYVDLSSMLKSERFSILCTPVLRESWPTLDTFFVKTYVLVWKADPLFKDKLMPLDDVLTIEKEAERLRRDFPMDEMIPSQHWQPELVGVMPAPKKGAQPQVGYWPGPVCKYYDLYVASIMNSYRKTRLLLLNIIIACQQARQTETDTSIQEEISQLASDIASSIPFHLTDNVDSFINQSLTSNGTTELVPGRSAGGLLIMHALYNVAIMPFVDPALKGHFRQCLVWIGENMGIGQATMLAEAEVGVHCDYIGEAHLLIWASMLI